LGDVLVKRFERTNVAPFSELTRIPMGKSSSLIMVSEGWHGWLFT
jgi:hypothetical protein